MQNIHEVLKKAKAEGKIDTDLLPWEKAETGRSEISNADSIADAEHTISPENFEVPPAFLRDIERTAENIKLLTYEEGQKIIGFASAQPQEGTSTLLAMIGYVLANQQSKVLMLDTQSRHPSLHRTFGKALQPGLSEALRGESPFEKVFQRISDSELHLVTAGSPLAEDKMTQKLAKTLATNRSKFDWIFLDLPPLVSYTEGLALSTLCDGVILVVGANQTRREIIETAIDQLQRSNTNLLGCVLNRRRFYLPRGVYQRL